MEELKTYEARIHAAFARIAASSQQLTAAPQAKSGGVSAPSDAMADLQVQNDILRAELASIKTISTATQDAATAGELAALNQQISGLEKVAAERSEQIASLNSQLRDMQIANAELTDALSNFRSAAENNQADSAEINRAMQAELEAKTQQLTSYEMQVNLLLAEFERLMEADNGAG